MQLGIVGSKSRICLDVSNWCESISNCYASSFLGFNEPDLPESHEGNYISPYDAVNLWKPYIQPIKASCGTALDAPAVTNEVGCGWATDWFSQFFDNCQSPDCLFDFIPFH